MRSIQTFLRRAARGTSPPREAVSASASPPESVLACPARPGLPVPEGFFGLRVAPNLAESRPVACGHELQWRKGDPDGTRYWWLREAPWVIRFAPQPSAPEAGLHLAVRPVIDTGEASIKLLRWLESQSSKATITRQDLAAQWQEEAAFRTLPPCASASVLAERKAWLDEHLFWHMGCRVAELSRADLHPDITALAPTQASCLPESKATSSADTGHQGARPLHGQDHAPASDGSDADNEPWLVVQARDELACARLRDELPELAARLRNAWGQASSWSSDAALMLRQRDTLNLLQMLASGVRLLPSLDRQASGPAATAAMAGRRRIAAESRRAEQALGDVWQSLQRLPDGAAPDAPQLDELVIAAGRLAVATRRRQDAWWTLRPDQRPNLAIEPPPAACPPASDTR